MKRIIFAALTLTATVGITACGEGNRAARPIEAAQRQINNRLGQLTAAEPIPRMLDSADRAIQRDFYTAEADPNKIWYLATLSMTGSIEATYTIRGPVVPASDEVTNPQQLVCSPNNNGEGCGTIGLAEPNGIYQGHTNDHLARLVSGALLRFEGQYQTSDQPFTVKTPESLTVNASASISTTDLSKTEGGTLPPKH